jgi:hypothetical protein
MPADPAAAAPVSATTLLLAAAASVAGILGMAALWTMLNLQTGVLNGWVALLVAVDAAILLRLAGLRRGPAGVVLAVASTAAASALAGFLTTVSRVGYLMGLQPFESAGRMSSGLALALLESALRPWDWAGLLAGLLLAWWLCR